MSAACRHGAAHTALLLALSSRVSTRSIPARTRLSHTHTPRARSVRLRLLPVPSGAMPPAAMPPTPSPRPRRPRRDAARDAHCRTAAATLRLVVRRHDCPQGSERTARRHAAARRVGGAARDRRCEGFSSARAHLRSRRWATALACPTERWQALARGSCAAHGSRDEVDQRDAGYVAAPRRRARRAPLVWADVVGLRPGAHVRVGHRVQRTAHGVASVACTLRRPGCGGAARRRRILGIHRIRHRLVHSWCVQRQRLAESARLDG